MAVATLAGKAAVYARIEGIVGALSAQSTVWSKAQVREQLTQVFIDEPTLLNPEDAARRLVDDWHEAQKPKPKKLAGAAKQLTFFQADAVLALGEGEYVRMKSATLDHVTAWRDVLKDEFEASAAKFHMTMAYINGVLPLFSPKNRTLGDIEGYVP